MDSETAEAIVKSSPAVVYDRVYVGTWEDLSLSGSIYCFDAYTGDELWRFDADERISATPAVDNHRVFVGSINGTFYCLNYETGDPEWVVSLWDLHDFPLQQTVSSSAAVGVIDDPAGPPFGDLRVFVGSDDIIGKGHIYCLDVDNGDLEWHKQTDDDVDSSPAVADNKVYVGSDDDNIYCLDAWTGTKIWNYTTGGNVYSSPAVSCPTAGKLWPCRWVYAGSNDGNVYAFGDYCYSLTIITSTGGTTDPSSGTHTYIEGKIVPVLATSYTCYEFDHWELDGSWDYSNPISVTMDCDHTLHAVFELLPLPCCVSPTSLNFGTVGLGNHRDKTFTINNTGFGTLTGNVSESCSHYSIISGGGSYSLGANQSVTVTVRFAPITAGTHTCTIETGTGLCNDVSCTGVGGVVGGIWVPVDKFSLLAPYIGVAPTILVATVAAAIYAKRVKQRKEKQ